MYSRTAHKPILFEAKEAHQKGIITYLKNGAAVLGFGNDRFTKVSTDEQFDLTQATIFGLNERLTMTASSPVIDKNGKTLREKFNNEWMAYMYAIENKSGGAFNYGTYAYYQDKNHLVRYCPAYWHKIVSVASNSKLLSDPENKLSWAQIRKVFDNTTIGVAGGSVGNNIIHLIAMDIRPDNLKIADKSMYKMENINRVRLGYWDLVEPNKTRKTANDILLKNKAETTASQLYSIDPYINVFVYPEGIHKKNLQEFFQGAKNEPPIDVVVEEVDDPRTKILIREEARRRKIPLVMVTDVGSSVQLDVLRYDKNKQLPLTYGTSDKKLYEDLEAVYQNPGDREQFFRFVDTLIGKDYRVDELQQIILQNVEIPTSTIIPQLGSTAAMAGAIAAETIARLRLGYSYPSRAIINKKTFAVKTYD